MKDKQGAKWCLGKNFTKINKYHVRNDLFTAL